MAAAAAAEVGTSALPQIGSPSKKTARIQIDVESAATGQASDSERTRNKRGSIGVTKLNETKARRAAAALQQQQACQLSCLLQTPARPAVLSWNTASCARGLPTLASPLPIIAAALGACA